LGNCILALGAFPYYLQFAKGDLKLAIIGNVLFLTLFIPSLLFATWHYGIKGPGYAWLGIQALLFLLWLPKVHERLVKGLHSQWLFKDVAPIAILSGLLLFLAHKFVIWPAERLSVAITLSLVSLASLVIAATGSTWVRETIRIRWRMLFTAKVG
jgi:hypothetical protein